MKKKRILVTLVVLALLILLVPVPALYKDGGTKTFTSLTYKVIIWNRLDGKRGTEVHFFPNNFHILSYYDDQK